MFIKVPPEAGSFHVRQDFFVGGGANGLVREMLDGENGSEFITVFGNLNFTTEFIHAKVEVGIIHPARLVFNGF